MTATEQREISRIEWQRIGGIATRKGISTAKAHEIRRERLRRLRTLLLLRHEAKTVKALRGGAEPNRAWYIRQVSRVTWAIDGGRRS